MTFNILIPIGCRSDEGLSAPVIRLLKKEAWCGVWTYTLKAQDFVSSYVMTEVFFKLEGKPDLILITGDRVEMCASACAAFHNNVKIAHLYAGIVNDPITIYDDIDRHCITLWSDIQFCENEEAVCQVTALLYPFKYPDAVYNVGITHLDDLEIDDSKVPVGMSEMPTSELNKVPYDLILYNTPTKEYQVNDTYSLAKYLDDRYTILVSGNPDGDKDTMFKDFVDEFFINLPRAQFLGLLKNCSRFITNSSSAIYEAPYFLKPEQIIMIGDRNKNRPEVDCKPGGSEKIVKILKEYAKITSKGK